MKIKKLQLFTNKLQAEKLFYTETIGFELLEESIDSFTVKIGWTELTFHISEKAHLYHYCFLIPNNQFQSALEWMEKRTGIIPISSGEKTVFFEDWNAHSFYFYDASGNIAECIVRHDLKNEVEEDFNIHQFLCINEMGTPTNDIRKTSDTLKQYFGTTTWKGNLDRFVTNGSQEGMFLLPNYEVKEKWYPTEHKIIPEHYQMTLENEGKIFNMEFRDGKIIQV